MLFRSGASSSGGSAGAGGSTAAQSQRILSPRGSVLFETRTNQLFVSDIPGKLEEITQLIAKIDTEGKAGAAAPAPG